MEQVNSRGRDECGQFVKGYSGNPKGRPKGSVSFKGALLRQIERGDTFEAVVRRLEREIARGNLAAMDLVLRYALGRDG